MRNVLCFAFFLPATLLAQSGIDHWEAVVLDGSTWSYLIPTAQPDANWLLSEFDDSGWFEGNSGFGYGDDDDETLVDQTMSIYLRHQFELGDMDTMDSALFLMDYDDGFVAYLNGIEITRGNAGEPGEFIAWNQNLPIDKEAVLYSGGIPDAHPVDFASLLFEGMNILAIEVHNANPSSSDLTARPFLMIGATSEVYQYSETPDWFVVLENSCEEANYVVVLNTENWANELQWYIETFDGELIVESNGEYANYEQYEQFICLQDTCYIFWMVDTSGDGWSGGSFELQDLEGNAVLSGELINGNEEHLYFYLGGVCEIEGCTDPLAINYEEFSNVDDGSCVVFEETNLPIIKLFTEESIPDEPRIVGEMAITNNIDSTNHVNDPPNGYNGYISIEIRGSSSQTFPKKSYALETQDSLGANNNVSLLGMPEENDWILHGPYTDKTLMRNAIIFQLGHDAGRYTPRTRYCELFINDDYRGVYMLMENIKRDANRVDIANLLPVDTIGDEITGGYILKIDKFTGGFEGGWTSPYSTEGGEDLVIQFHKPEIDDLNEPQIDYIQNHITEFEDALAGDNFTDSILGYQEYIDVLSFVDLYLINELSKNIDGYRFSTYFYKQKDSNGGKIVMGPWWDYNLSLGNANYCEGWEPTGFEVNTGCGNINPFWFERLLEDPAYSNLTRCVWEGYRADAWSDESVHERIDSLETLLADANVRDHVRWPRLGEYVWPNWFIGDTYEQEIDFMREWLDERLAWLDVNIAGNCAQGCTDVTACNYNPNATVDDGSCETQSCNCYGDLNGDSAITITDILIVLSEFGCMSNCTADLDYNGYVSINDILELLALFGSNC
jgi:hypothetical protein